MWFPYVLIWVLEGIGLALALVAYFRFTRKANRIRLPDLPPLEPPNLDSLLLLSETLVLHQERLEERMAIRARGIRLNWWALGLTGTAVLMSVVNLTGTLLGLL